VPVREVLGVNEKTATYARGIDKARRKLAPEATAIGLDARRAVVLSLEVDTVGWFPEQANDALGMEVCELDGRDRALVEKIKYWVYKRTASDPPRVYGGGRLIPWTQSILRVWTWRDFKEQRAYTPA
jgi:hypothetical protein